MFNDSFIFCKIIQKKIDSTIIKENDHVMVIEDIAPKAPTHYIIIPKKHIESILYLTDEDSTYTCEILRMARKLGQTVPSKSFNLISNNGTQAGQSVPHLHFHFISGKNIYEHGFSL